MARKQDLDHLARLATLSRKARHRPRRMTDEELADLPRLYRAAASITSRLVTRGDQPAATREAKRALAGAHAELHSGLRSDRTPWWRRFARLALVEGPRTVRAEWKVFTSWAALFYGLFGLGWVLVAQDLALGFQLAGPHAAGATIDQLDSIPAGEAWEGNFTFSPEDSHAPAGAIMGNNLLVAAMWAVFGLIPPLLVWRIVGFALSIGAYVGISSHWEQSASIFSILMCHGTIELTAVFLSCTAGTVIARALAAPGAYGRAYALKRAGGRALRLLIPTVPMLVLAALIEGYVSPHASTGVRVGVAVLSALMLIAWLGFVGREPRSGPELAPETDQFQGTRTPLEKFEPEPQGEPPGSRYQNW